MIFSTGIVDKDGSILVARQYCDMSRSKVEALYTTFARLLTKGKQHTIIESNEVRYVYRAINELYCVLITDKSANILEDIKTLSLVTSATIEYAAIGKSDSEDKISEVRFDLLFIFDEIICMGVRQIDNLTQLRAVIEMESEMERSEIINRSKKEREAKAKAAEKAKEFDLRRKNEMLRQVERGLPDPMPTRTEPVAERAEPETIKPARVMSRGRALRLKK